MSGANKSDEPVEVEVTCDRCGKRVRGLRYARGTSGFYVLRGAWSQFSRVPGEGVLCEPCMQADPHYQATCGMKGLSSPVHFSGEEGERDASASSGL